MTDAATILHGSAHDLALPDESVHMIATSPPYWGLRSYAGDQEVDWPAVTYAPMPGLAPLTVPPMRCGLGAESTPEAYIGHLVLCLREWWRVLRDDGTCFVNLGDSYSGSGGYYPNSPSNLNGSLQSGGNKTGMRNTVSGTNANRKVSGLKPKDLCLIPARFALAAQADGWWVRSDIPWVKRNPMPGSQQDRPTTSHEHIYLLAKSQTYFWDQEAIKMISAGGANGSEFTKGNTSAAHPNTGQGPRGDDTKSRIRRTADWWFDSIDAEIAHLLHIRVHGGALLDEHGISALQINNSGSSLSHFAMWPEKLVEPMVLAGTSARGVCPECGAPWRRVVERTAETYNDKEGTAQQLRSAGAQNGGTEKVTLGVTDKVHRQTLGWEPTCAHGDLDPVPATVADFFSGSGTTGRVALRLGRAYIGNDLSAEYIGKLAPKRLTVQMGMGL